MAGYSLSPPEVCVMTLQFSILAPKICQSGLTFISKGPVDLYLENHWDNSGVGSWRVVKYRGVGGELERR